MVKSWHNTKAWSDSLPATVNIFIVFHAHTAKKDRYNKVQIFEQKIEVIVI